MDTYNRPKKCNYTSVSLGEPMNLLGFSARPWVAQRLLSLQEAHPSVSEDLWQLLLRSSLHNLKAAPVSSLLSLRFTAEHPQSYKYISLDALHPHKAPPPYGFQPSQTLSLLGIKCSNAWAYERHFTFTQQHSTPGFPRLISFHKIHLIYKSPHGLQ